MTNRQRLLRAVNDLGRIKQDPAVSPTPYSHLADAQAAIILASQFVLDVDERDKGGRIDGFSTGMERP